MFSRSVPAAAAVAVASMLLAACGGSSGSGGASSAHPSSAASATPAAASSAASASATGGGTVRSASNPSLGARILVDASGMTLYRLSGESAGRFICTSQSCLAVWHPLRAGSSAPTGAAGLGTVRRPDGTEQVTYEGGPLYTFSPDKAPGQANGQGLKDVGTWSVVKLGGATARSSGAASTSGEPGGSGGSGGGGYSY